MKIKVSEQLPSSEQVYISTLRYILFFPTFFFSSFETLFLYFLENYYIINGWSLLSPSFFNMSSIKRMNSNGEERNGISLIHALVIYFINLASKFFSEKILVI